MKPETANALITKLWEIGEALKAVQRDLDAIEGVIVDMVPDDD